MNLGIEDVSWGAKRHNVHGPTYYIRIYNMRKFGMTYLEIADFLDITIEYARTCYLLGKNLYGKIS